MATVEILLLGKATKLEMKIQFTFSKVFQWAGLKFLLGRFCPPDFIFDI